MVNIIVDPLTDHIGKHILHWIINQSGQLYSKVNENLQNNLKNIETGVAVIDHILTPTEEEFPGQQDLDRDNEDDDDNFIRNQNYNHINILNQIINMNINLNDRNNNMLENDENEGKQFKFVRKTLPFQCHFKI
jgi:hypothetical protein